MSFMDSGKPHKLDIGPLSFDLPASIPPIALPIAAAVIVLLLLLFLVIPRCSHAPEQQAASDSNAASSQAAASATAASAGSEASSSAASQTSTATTTQTSSIFFTVGMAIDEAKQSVQSAGQVESLDQTSSNQGALVTLLGDETAAKLLAQAKTNVDALWIAAHPAEYGIDGVEVQYKILKLAADEPASLDYVRDFPSSYPASQVNEDKSLAMSTSSPSSSVPDTNIPHLYQWDRRWGYTTYSGAAFGLTGCGPTSLAMVYQGLTGSKDKSPYDMGKLANERGYMSEYEGTEGTFFTETAKDLGLACDELYPETETLKSALEHGQTVILNLAPGYFTMTGHYIVVTDLTSDGKAIINDPYSVERASQTWDLALLTSQSYAMYGYSKA